MPLQLCSIYQLSLLVQFSMNLFFCLAVLCKYCWQCWLCWLCFLFQPMLSLFHSRSFTILWWFMITSAIFVLNGPWCSDSHQLSTIFWCWEIIFAHLFIIFVWYRLAEIITLLTCSCARWLSPPTSILSDSIILLWKSLPSQLCSCPTNASQVILCQFSDAHFIYSSTQYPPQDLPT